VTGWAGTYGTGWTAERESEGRFRGFPIQATDEDTQLLTRLLTDWKTPEQAMQARPIARATRFPRKLWDTIAPAGSEPHRGFLDAG